MALAEKRCVPCSGGVPPLQENEYQPLLNQLTGWQVIKGHHLEKKYTFPDFKLALLFVNQIGAISEQENHHPEIQCGWGHVTVQIWTHKIDGLTESDFILAAKCDEGV